MNHSPLPTPARRPDERPAGQNLLRRAVAALAKLAAGLLIWAAIIFTLALFIAPTKSKGPRFAVSGHSTVPVTDTSFTNTEICSGCHWDAFAQWSQSMHSHANTDAFYRAVYKRADIDTGGRAERFCGASRCHSPAAFLAGEDPFGTIDDVAKTGVFCDFCHTISSRRGIGDASYVSSPGRVKRGPYRRSQSPYHLTAYSPQQTRSEFCGICHNVTNPVTGLKLETTYEEWAQSRYNRHDPAKNTECQGCHMKPYAGRASDIGPRRPEMFAHTFVGARSFAGGGPEFDYRERAVIARLRSAARLRIVSVNRTGNRVLLAVRVTNVGAGHSLPTGVTDVRQMWLRLTVRSASGEVYSSGALDTDGMLDQNAHVFGTVLGDANGRPVDKAWRAAKLLRDTRVPAGGSTLERYACDVSADAGPLAVTAELMYRSAPQQVVDAALGKGKMTVPMTKMARATARIGG